MDAKNYPRYDAPNLFRFNPRARDGRESFVGLASLPANCFNPRARDGRENLHFGVFLNGKLVSIHAPVMDANLCLCHQDHIVLFQSTRP